MGVAILSGVLSSLDPKLSSPIPKWESHTSGTVTPVAFVEEDPTLPARFLVCVSREVSARQLKPTFTEISSLGAAVEVFVANNVQAVKQSDVIILWSASFGYPQNFAQADSPPQLQAATCPRNPERIWDARSLRQEASHQHSGRCDHQPTF